MTELIQWGIFLSLFVVVCFKRQDLIRLQNTCILGASFLLLFLAARLALVVCYPSIFEPLSCLQILQALWKGLRFDLSMIALLLSLPLILLNLPILREWWQKIWMGVGAVLLGACTLITVGDVVYFGVVGRHTGADIWNLFSTFALICQIVVEQYAWALVLVGVWVVFIVWLFVWLARKWGRPSRGPWVWEILFLVMLSWALWMFFKGYLGTKRSVLPQQAYEQHYEQGHLIQNGIFAIAYALKPSLYVPHVKALLSHPTLSMVSSEDALQTALQIWGDSPQEELVDPEYPLLRKRTQFNADARGYNLIILVLESLDYDKVDSLAGTSHGATPNLDALISQGLQFDNFYGCGQDSSLVGVGTLMSGICQVSGTPYYGRGLEAVSVSRLGNLFSRAGYETVFVRATRDPWMYIGPVSRLMGFTSYDETHLTPHFPYKKEKAVYDYDSLMLLAEKMKASGKPFFGFFLSLATHTPYTSFVPETFGDGREKDFSPNTYLQALSYTDWALGEFIAELKKNNLYEKTVFVIVGDHRNRENSYSKLQKFFHVPFVLVAPGIIPPGRTAQVGGQADVLPTLVDLFHLSTPYVAMGQSLFDKSKKPFSFITHMNGMHFGVATDKGVLLETDEVLLRMQDPQPQARQLAVLVNKALHELLTKNKLVPLDFSSGK